MSRIITPKLNYDLELGLDVVERIHN